MYAVVSSGGKQYRVEPGSTLTVEKLTEEAGASVTFDRVLLIADGDDIRVGTPTVVGATISATVLGAELGPKIVVFKFKQKVKYRRRTGHRQHLTRVRIDEISASGSSRRSTARTRERAAPEAKATAATTAPAEKATPAKKRATAAKASTTAKPRASRAAPSTAAAAKKPATRRVAKPKE